MMNLSKQNIFKSLVIGATALLVMPAMVSCDDDEDSNADPCISYIRTTIPEQSDSLLDAAALGSTIAIIGENLENIRAIKFNDIDGFINTNFLSNSSFIVKVPSGIPTVITNKIYITAKNGNVIEYPFTATIPAPVVSSVKSEMALAGDKAYFYGNYFVNNDENPISVSFNAVEAEVDKSLSDNSTLVVTVPAGTTDSDVPVIRTAYGSCKVTSINGSIHDYVIDDYSGKEQGNIITDATTGNEYIHLAGSGVGQWSWVNDCMYIGKFNDAAMTDLPDGPNYYLKFEIRTNKPWVAGALSIVLRNGSDKDYSWKWEGTEGIYSFAQYEPWLTDGSFNTEGEWVTVKVSLSDFVYTKAHAEATYTDAEGNSKTLKANIKDIHGIRFFVWGGDAPATESGDVDIDIDNLRIYSE